MVVNVVPINKGIKYAGIKDPKEIKKIRKDFEKFKVKVDNLIDETQKFVDNNYKPKEFRHKLIREFLDLGKSIKKHEYGKIYLPAFSYALHNIIARHLFFDGKVHFRTFALLSTETPKYESKIPEVKAYLDVISKGMKRIISEWIKNKKILKYEREVRYNLPYFLFKKFYWKGNKSNFDSIKVFVTDEKNKFFEIIRNSKSNEVNDAEIREYISSMVDLPPDYSKLSGVYNDEAKIITINLKKIEQLSKSLINQLTPKYTKKELRSLIDQQLLITIAHEFMHSIGGFPSKKRIKNEIVNDAICEANAIDFVSKYYSPVKIKSDYSMIMELLYKKLSKLFGEKEMVEAYFKRDLKFIFSISNIEDKYLEMLFELAEKFYDDELDSFNRLSSDMLADKIRVNVLDRYKKIKESLGKRPKSMKINSVNSEIIIALDDRKLKTNYGIMSVKDRMDFYEDYALKNFTGSIEDIVSIPLIGKDTFIYTLYRIHLPAEDLSEDERAIRNFADLLEKSSLPRTRSNAILTAFMYLQMKKFKKKKRLYNEDEAIYLGKRNISLYDIAAEIRNQYFRKSKIKSIHPYFDYDVLSGGIFVFTSMISYMKNQFSLESDVKTFEELLASLVNTYYSEPLFENASLIDHLYGYAILLGRELFIRNIGFPKVRNVITHLMRRYDLTKEEALRLINAVNEYAETIGFINSNPVFISSKITKSLYDFEILGMIKGAQENFWRSLINVRVNKDIKSRDLIDYFENAILENRISGSKRPKFCMASYTFYAPIILAAELYA